MHVLLLIRALSNHAEAHVLARLVLGSSAECNGLSGFWISELSKSVMAENVMLK
jgi:hypothetical protein